MSPSAFAFGIVDVRPRDLRGYCRTARRTVTRAGYLVTLRGLGFARWYPRERS
jgi:hypothetical protein